LASWASQLKSRFGHKENSLASVSVFVTIRCCRNILSWENGGMGILRFSGFAATLAGSLVAGVAPGWGLGAGEEGNENTCRRGQYDRR
jgi:hypothetical protein